MYLLNVYINKFCIAQKKKSMNLTNQLNLSNFSLSNSISALKSTCLDLWFLNTDEVWIHQIFHSLKFPPVMHMVAAVV